MFELPKLPDFPNLLDEDNRDEYRYWILVAVAIGMNWAALVPAYLFQTEKFYDLTGALTFVALLVAALGLRRGISVLDDPFSREFLTCTMLVLSTARLGAFLFIRVLAEGKDRRFDKIKVSPVRFFVAWTLQGLWALLTGLPVYTLILEGDYERLDVAKSPLDMVLIGLWFFGVVMESVADHQKFMFRLEERNHDKFIKTGVWAWSRHPNYFGRMTYSWSLAILAVQGLKPWYSFSVFGPLFETLLLLFVSGIPLLEKYAEKKWGEPYKKHQKKTASLIPFVI